ncbi:hypothetical protein [Hyalangium versicolor]|uniref:hypothetical protein n=1 Tax=Hyalangium versicolor TaxID=2861190 RepID=UPI001CCAB2EF|nr:hypothetical protein [Hyalangium versicolor]
MKKWLTLMVFGAAVVATVGLSSRVSAQPEHELTDAEIDARVDARLQEVMRTTVLAGQRSETRTAALSR